MRPNLVPLFHFCFGYLDLSGKLEVGCSCFLHLTGMSIFPYVSKVLRKVAFLCGDDLTRFRLLTRIRIAHGFGTLEGRRHLVLVRLLAFCVLFQSNPLHGMWPILLSSFLHFLLFWNNLNPGTGKD